MEIIKNIGSGEFGLEGNVYFPVFSKYISLSVDDDNTAFAENCAACLNSLPYQVVEQLCKASIRYCNDFLAGIGEPLKVFTKETDVLRLVSPVALLVPFPRGASEPVIHLELNCDWEPEHGMEWIVRNDEVVYVGAFHCHDPFSDPGPVGAANYA